MAINNHTFPTVGRFVDKMADEILMQVIHHGHISSVTSDDRNSKEYRRCQSAARAILDELFTEETQYGNTWDLGSVHGETGNFHQAESKGDALYHADEYWSIPVERVQYTALTEFKRLPPSDIK